MTVRFFKQKFRVLLFVALTCVLPSVGISNTDEVIREKREMVAMRSIGHEMLVCLGDEESRVLPVEKIDEHYKVSFGVEFAIDPDDIISIVAQVMRETGIAADYFVEVQQCESKKIVHSFEVRNPAFSILIPCKGRIIPKDCYSLLLTILDPPPAANLQDLEAASPIRSNPSKTVLVLVPLFILLGFVAYIITKRNTLLAEKHLEEMDPNLIWVGASQFDKRNMILSFGDKRVELSNTEAELLTLLHSNANGPIEREVILSQVWGDEGDYVGRTLDVFISKLRKKLEDDSSVKIVNIRGVGYKLVMNVPG